MVQPKAQKVVAAKVVDVDESVEPVDAVVVADKRNTLGKRLGIFALVILLLFFVVNSYIQSAKNGRALRHAANDRSDLIHSVKHLTDTIDTQTILIERLQNALRVQNKTLKEHGFKTVHIPSSSSSGSSSTNSSSQPQPQPSPGTSPKPKPSPNPSPKPKPSPSSSPGPIGKVKNRVCNLTGICIIFSRIPSIHF